VNKNFWQNSHTKETLSLAWPLIITQVGHIITGMVDTIFLGQIGPTEQAAGIFSNNLYVLLLVWTIGMSYAITPLVTEAHESTDLNRKATLFKNALILNVGVAALCFLILFFLSGYLKYMHQPAEVVELAVPFFNVLIFSIVPVSFFFVCKQYCEGLSNTRMALVISITGNLLNIVLNYSLIYGKLGFPAMGYMGSAWATFWARMFMGAAFLLLVFKSPLTREISGAFSAAKFQFRTIVSLWRLGVNSALQFTFEVAAFVIAGLMAGGFGKEQIDAHGIALSIAAFTYMFATGISSAGTIRAGSYKAQGDWKGVIAASKTAITLVLLIMGSFALIFFTFHSFLPLAFSKEPQILMLAGELLVIAALFQLFDGLQVVVIGLLRGLQDVRVPTIITFVGYWVIAVPFSYLLGYTFKLETFGIWIALLSSLVFVAAGVLLRLRYVLRNSGSPPRSPSDLRSPAAK
jgi:MATE family multidrug resistance protein